jgi:hypothetical protein
MTQTDIAAFTTRSARYLPRTTHDVLAADPPMV